MVLRRLIPIIVLFAIIGAVVFIYVPAVSEAQVSSTEPSSLPESSDPSTWTCTGGCPTLNEPSTDPVSANTDAPETYVPLPDPSTKPIGTAYVTVTIRFTDGTEKVMTSKFSLLSVVVEGREVSYMTYEVEVNFRGLGEVYLTDLLYGLYLVPENGPGKTIETGGVSESIRAPAGTTIQIVNMVIQASKIESFMSAGNMPDGNYVLRFWTGFNWAGSAVDSLNDKPGYGSAAISGPDIPASITVPYDGGEQICFDRRQVCIQ